MRRTRLLDARLTDLAHRLEVSGADRRDQSKTMKYKQKSLR